MLLKLNTALAISFFIAGTSAAKEPDVALQLSAYKTLNVFSVSTDSIMGDDVARHFSQMLYLQDISIYSSLSIREVKLSGSASQITLETPLRVISAHKFLTKQRHRWTDPQSVAQTFIAAAQEKGLLKIPNP